MVLSSIFQKRTAVGGQSGGFAQMAPIMQGFGEIGPLIVKNRGFLAKIFTNLLVQLAITYYVFENYPVTDHKWLFFFASLGCIIIIAGTNLPYWAKALIFAVFSYMSGRVLAVYKEKYSEEAIRGGILGAMGIFAIMFIVGAAIPLLGEKFGWGLFFALLGLLIARIVSILNGKIADYKKWLSVAGIGIFGLFVMYDTNNILKRASYYDGDFITASMDYYLDIINLVQDVIGFNS